MPNGGNKNSWFEPQTIIGVAGLLAIGYSGYRDFQSDLRAKVEDIRNDVTELKTRVGYLEREHR